MPILKSGKARIHYVLEGQSESPVLLFSNSLGANYSTWDPQAHEFRKKLRVLRYDTRGHGQSPPTPGTYSIELLGRDVIAMLDALDLDRVHFCGLSMGGMIGMWLALNAPERLNKIRTPTLVIAGAHDPATPPEGGRFLAQQIPGARFVELDAAHLSNIEAQDRFNNELAAFLNS